MHPAGGLFAAGAPFRPWEPDPGYRTEALLTLLAVLAACALRLAWGVGRRLAGPARPAASPARRRFDWCAAFGVAGVCLGLTAAAVVDAPFESALVLMAEAGALGAAAGWVLARAHGADPRRAGRVERAAVLLLAGAEGAIVGWRLVWPAVYFSVPGLSPAQEKGIFWAVTGSTAGAGALLGWAAWAWESRRRKAVRGVPDLPAAPDGLAEAGGPPPANVRR
jgi:hypothetical protein